LRSPADVGRILEAEPRGPARTLAFTGLVADESGLGDRLVVVGGSAIEILTAGAYVSDDIDLVDEGRERQRIVAILRRWGFRRSGRGWSQKGWAIYVDLPPGPYDGFIDLTTVVQTPFGPVRVAAAEDLLVGKLAMAKYWHEEVAIREAALLIARFSDLLNWPYVEKEAGRENVAELLPVARRAAGLTERVTGGGGNNSRLVKR
jgi:hypothetical protein